MSRIVIDGRMLGWTGIGRYTKSLLEELEQLDADNSYVVLIQRKDWSRWTPAQPNFQRFEVNINPYSFGEQLRLPWILYGLRADMVHFLNFNSPLLYLRKRVVTIHDLTLLDFKNYRGDGWKKLVYELKYLVMRVVFRAAVTAATKIITDTEYNKDELLTRNYAPAAKITAIHLGTPRLPAVTAHSRPANQSPYLLYVGNLYPYKNILRVIEALPQLLIKYPTLSFIIVGDEDVFSRELHRRIKELRLEQAVVFTGFVSDSELADYYRRATLYVFPSLSEGFGLPPLEAMSYGLPVVAANASCLPEVCGEAAAYFNPHDVADITRVINESLGDPKRLAALKAAGLKRIKTFSWKRMAEQTLAVYKEALK
jgi:glycosyltransferase involved in cell wall biosynthesis